ncbi:MAG: type II toxin-antitoxin system RelB/DinJ family antitoxin [Defluviitaleaceae bacterium]|nr:type II toxin-antitoxin system RelB/DinJ family antitoxin [Defluviitaleaceae bacterium]
MTQISIPMDESLIKEADAILEELGINMSFAVTIFIKQLVRQGGFPFAPTLNTHHMPHTTQQERLASFLHLASNSKKIEGDFKFNRDECYE